jgi:hypothetical protein
VADIAPKRRSSFLRRLRRATLVLLLIIIVAAVVLWRLSWIAPSWYEPPAASDTHSAALADKVETRVLEEAQKIRPTPADRWTIRVRQEQINAWLCFKLRKWIEYDRGGSWPPELGTPQVRIEADGLSIALPIARDATSSSRTLVARIKPRIINSALALELDRVALGRISLPGEPLANLLQTLSDAAPQAKEDPTLTSVLDLLAQRTQIDPVIKLSDGRRVRLLDLRLGDGFIDLTAQTLAE